MKTCSRCRVSKPTTEFFRNKSMADGLQNYCKLCITAYRKEGGTRTQKGTRTNLPTADVPIGQKLCPKCGKIKSRDEFWKSKTRADGCTDHCKKCHAEHVKEARLRNPTAKREANKRHRQKYTDRYRERSREQTRRRYARKAYLGIKVNRVVFADIVARDGWICGICGGPIDKKLRYPAPKCVSIDHIAPLSRGGDHTLENLQLAHLSCNLLKGHRVPASEGRVTV